MMQRTWFTIQSGERIIAFRLDHVTFVMYDDDVDGEWAVYIYLRDGSELRLAGEGATEVLDQLLNRKGPFSSDRVEPPVHVERVRA